MLLQPFDHNYQSVQVKQDYEIVNKVVLNTEKLFSKFIFTTIWRRLLNKRGKKNLQYIPVLAKMCMMCIALIEKAICLCMSRDPSRDGWLKEFIKQK